jgi:hypothetical protein
MCQRTVLSPENNVNSVLTTETWKLVILRVCQNSGQGFLPAVNLTRPNYLTPVFCYYCRDYCWQVAFCLLWRNQSEHSFWIKLVNKSHNYEGQGQVTEKCFLFDTAVNCYDYISSIIHTLNTCVDQNESDGWNWGTQKKTYPSATLSTTNPTWTRLRSNPDLHGKRPLPARGIAWPRLKCYMDHNSSLLSC